MLSTALVLNMFGLNLSKRMESNTSCVKWCTTWSWLWQFSQLKTCYKIRPNYPLSLTLVIILFVSGFGPELSLKQCCSGKVVMTILTWKLGSTVHVHTKLVLKLVSSGRVICYNTYALIQEKDLHVCMSVITWDSVKTVLAQCPERNAFL